MAQLTPSPPLLRAVDLHKTHHLKRGAALSLKELAIQGLFRSVEMETIEALRGVSLEVHAGETVGVIGRNGAGKSTLLKIVAGITPPDSGRVETVGRVGSFIELGAGFHPELSGSENIFLMASLVGLPKSFARERYAKIVAFSGVEDFIHVPIKHYSSGMVARLAFSAAAHFDPKILLLDEVMAVGDGDFQERGVQKIEQLRQEGAAILLVSHDLHLIERTCDRAIWLEGGRVARDGDPILVVGEYVEDETRREALRGPSSALEMSDHKHVAAARFGSGELIISRVSMKDAQGRRKRLFHSGELVEIEIEFRRPLDSELDPARARRQEPGPASVIVSITRKDNVGICYLPMINRDAPPLPALEPGETATATARFDRFGLAAASYQLSVAAYPAHVGDFPRGENDYPYDCHLRLHDFSVLESPEGPPPLPGAVTMDFEASLEILND
jgi:ABC-type polysaccharide/polyol phosphate transport system ATPase subunit